MIIKATPFLREETRRTEDGKGVVYLYDIFEAYPSTKRLAHDVPEHELDATIKRLEGVA